MRWESEMGRERGRVERENDVSRRKPGVREFTQQREKAALHEQLKSRRYKQKFLLVAPVCICVCVWTFCFAVLSVECTCMI